MIPINCIKDDETLNFSLRNVGIYRTDTMSQVVGKLVTVIQNNKEQANMENVNLYFGELVGHVEGMSNILDVARDLQFLYREFYIAFNNLLLSNNMELMTIINMHVLDHDGNILIIRM